MRSARSSTGPPTTGASASCRCLSRYLDVESAATYLGMTPGALYASVARHKVPYRKVGRKLVFDRLELDSYIHSLEGVGVEEAVARALNNGTQSEIASFRGHIQEV